MCLYSTRSDTAFTLVQAARGERLSWRGGTPVSSHEPAPRLSPIDPKAEFIPVDCLSMIDGVDGVLLSDFARDALGGILSACGEFVPARVLEHTYWWFNCLASVDALDRQRTEADWSRVSGDWGSFEWISSTRRLEFDVGSLESAPPMFRIPEIPQGVVLASDTLVGTVAERELTGFQFDLVWSPSGGVLNPPGLGMAGLFDEERPEALEERRAKARMTLSARST